MGNRDGHGVHRSSADTQFTIQALTAIPTVPWGEAINGQIEKTGDAESQNIISKSQAARGGDDLSGHCPWRDWNCALAMGESWGEGMKTPGEGNKRAHTTVTSASSGKGVTTATDKICGVGGGTQDILHAVDFRFSV